MKKNLYIDFDGVILDTVVTTYKMLADRNIDRKEEAKVADFFTNLDWGKVIKATPEINDSVNEIKKICKSDKFDVFILTHVFSLSEIIEKTKYIKKHLPEVTIISVPKSISKTDIVFPDSSILIDDYSGNLKDWKEKGGYAVKFVKEKENGEYKEITKLSEILFLEDLWKKNK